MRLFIALELPAPVKQALAEAQTELRRARASVSWSKPENLHLTLKFLGETDAARLPELAAAGAATAAKTAPFALELTQVGGFPNLRQPRVLWVGLAGARASLLRLHGELETQLAAQGFPRETKPLHPHLTLGRVKPGADVRPLVELAPHVQVPSVAFTVSELVLMESQLHPSGSIYTPLHRAAFLSQAP